jgi:NADH dehydrogenase
MRWILLEAMDRVLPEIDRAPAEYALRELRSRGIDVRLGTTLEEVTATWARISTGEVIPTRTVLWTAGVTPHPSSRNLGLPLDERGRIRVDEYLRVAGTDDVWAVGDAAAVPDPRRPGTFCPPTSQHAVRQGKTAGHNVAASLGVGAPRRFSYKSKGQFVNLGRYKAVAQVYGITLRGFPAWWLARTYHVSQIPGFARKVRAVMDWTVGLPFPRDIAEVGTIGRPRPLKADAYERAGTHRS